MLGILTAPQLSKLEGVVSEVPILQSPDTYEPKPVARSKSSGDTERKPFREVSLEKPNTNSSNNFLWVAIASSLLLLAIWAAK
jgi:hypothetical protein